MKSMYDPWLFVAVSALACLPLSAQTAATTNTVVPAATPAQPAVVAPAPAPAAAPAVTETAPVKLPASAEDVLKLSRAQVSEEVVLNFINTSGSTYNLNPTDIVYLRNEGVPDRIINAMLDQRKKLAAETLAQAPQPAAPAPAGYDPNLVAAQNVQPAPVYVQPPQPQVQPAPAPSTLYVIPYPAASAAYYGYYRPYGYGYYGSPYSYYGPPYSYYAGPSLSVGVRIGGGGHSHSFYRHR